MYFSKDITLLQQNGVRIELRNTLYIQILIRKVFFVSIEIPLTALLAFGTSYSIFFLIIEHKLFLLLMEKFEFVEGPQDSRKLLCA